MNRVQFDRIYTAVCSQRNEFSEEKRPAKREIRLNQVEIDTHRKKESESSISSFSTPMHLIDED